MTYTCTVCGGTKTESIPMLVGVAAEPLMDGWTYGNVSLTALVAPRS